MDAHCCMKLLVAVGIVKQDKGELQAQWQEATETARALSNSGPLLSPAFRRWRGRMRQPSCLAGKSLRMRFGSPGSGISQSSIYNLSCYRHIGNAREGNKQQYEDVQCRRCD